MARKLKPQAKTADRNVRATGMSAPQECPRHTIKRKRPSRFLSTAFIYAGNDLLSHTLSRAVQSALRGLTSVFGMGTGGPPRYDHRRLERLAASFSLIARFAPNEELPLDSGANHRKLVKDPENDLSQLNRLDGPTFFFAYFRFQPSYAALLSHKSIGAKLLLTFLLHLRSSLQLE